MHSRLFSVLSLTALMSSLSLAACSDSGSSKNPTPPGGPPGGTAPARLVRAQTCDELETLLKGDAKKKLDAGIDEQIKAIRDYGGYWGYGYGRGVGGGEDSPVVGAPGSGGQAGSGNGGSGGTGGSGIGGSGGGAPAPTPTDGDGDESGGGDDGGGSPDYSDTNTQVKGVDEADFVEVDGENVYLLHGARFLTLGAQPNAPAVAQEIKIDGTPREMFVTRDGGPRRAVIYSDVNGAEVYAKAGVTPKPAYADYGYAPVAGGGRGTIDVIDVGGDDDDDDDDAPSPAPYVPLTKVTVLDLDGGQPSVLSEVYFEGHYSTARRVGTVVRTVLNGGEHGPEVKYHPSFAAGAQPPAAQDVEGWVAVFEQLREEGHAKIDASTANDWLPYYFVKQGASVSAKNLACESYHVPLAGTTQYGLTQVQSFDVASPAQVKGTAIVGRADVVYSNADSLYVAAHAWNPTPPPPVFPPPFPFPGEPFPGDGGGTAGGGTSGSPTGGSAGSFTGGSGGSGGSAGGSSGSDTGGTGTGGGSGGSDTGGTGTGGGSGGSDTGGTGSGGSDTGGTGTGGGSSGSDTGGTGTGGTGVGGSGPIEPPPPPPPTTLNSTHLHKFDLRVDPTSPLYVASGTVDGGVLNQFSLDERDGFLRVATNESRTTGQDFWTTARYNHLFVVAESNGELGVVGEVGDLAKDESIMSVRFVGAKGYVVTFLQKDPLFVFDLSDPFAPKLLGQLDIPGFSQYMHPIDDAHLLTIGQDGDQFGSNGRLALQIFDVSDPLQPRQAHKFTFSGDQYGYSQAQGDHKAFTYFDKEKLLAFPYSSNSFTPDGYFKPTSTLEIFRVDTATGFSRVGAVDHSPLFPPQPPCGPVWYYGPEVRRGLFINRDDKSYVYSISYAGMMVHDVAAIQGGQNGPVGQLNLLSYLDQPEPDTSGYGYGDDYGCAPPGPGPIPLPGDPRPEPAPAPGGLAAAR
ncbi:MAG TPA: beta-propeller domain-containing protein [Polyangiaceae bacterium]|nr:beta-propeller domain-containing protein [Polyangiaceae bacterium]